MGAWGSAPLENDGAGDLIAMLRDGQPVVDSVGWAFEDDYLEVDGGQIALALVEIALVALGRRPATAHLEGVDLDGFRAELTPDTVGWIVDVAEKTLSDAETSELYELWSEVGELDGWTTPSLESVALLRSITA